MAGFSINEVNKLTFKVQAGGVIDASAGNRWYESSLAFSPNIKDPSRILTDYNLIPPANLPVDAVNNASADPTNISDLSANASASKLDQVYAFNNSTWILYNTPGDTTSGFKNNWILPASVPQPDGTPSNGYGIKLWSGNPATGGTEIPLSAGQANNPGYVGWVFNYDQGLLFISDDLQQDITDNVGGAYPNGFDLYVTGFRYVGATGGGGGGAQGTQGTQGTGGAGSQGTIGAQGIQGTLGSQGTQGISGSGSQGTQGLQGTLGLQGTQGISGSGSQGTQGLQGTLGLQGTDGSQGIQGLQGTLGLQGTDGSQGVQGLQGTLGLQGTDGSQGIQGLQGTDGTQGTQGLQGTDGSQGTQGLQGTDGTQGIQGLQGTDGLQGTQGLQGLQGTQGVQGILGTGTQGTQGVSGAGGNITVANSDTTDGSSPTFLTGTYTKFNFVDRLDDNRVYAQEDPGDASQVNVFFPAPDAPIYPNYLNRNVATGSPTPANATIAENNNPVNRRIAIPNATLTGAAGGNYEDGGWSGSNTLRAVYKQDTQGTISFGSGNTASPVKVRGFGGAAGDGDGSITIDVLDGDGTTILESHTVNDIIADGDYKSTSENIILTISNYNTLVNPYNPQDVYEASVKIDVIMGVPGAIAGVGTGVFPNATNARDGGKFTIKISMTPDSSGLLVDPPSPDLPLNYSYTVFADANPNTPSLASAVSTFPNVDSGNFRYISGIKYYTNGTTLSSSVDDLLTLNGNSIIINNIRTRIFNWSSNTLSVNDTSYSLSNGTITLTQPGVVNDWDQTLIDYNNNASTFTIVNSNHRYRSQGGNSQFRLLDPWSDTGWGADSIKDKILIDVAHTTSTDLIEYFDIENKRLFRDIGGNTYSGWNSQLSLVDVSQPPNSRTSIVAENLCLVGGEGIAASDFYADNDGTGNLPSTGTIISGDLSNYIPSGNPNYNTMADTPIFHRLFNDPSNPNVVSFNLTFTGDPGVSANFTDALRNSQLKIYIWPVGANANAALQVDPNTGTNYTYLPTFIDSQPGNPYPNIQDSYALSCHGGNQGGAWSAGGWIPFGGTVPGAYTGLDDPGTYLMQASSGGNVGEFSFGSSSNVSIGGVYAEIQIIDRTIRLEQIQYTRIN